MMTTQAIPEGTRKVKRNDDRMIPQQQPRVTCAYAMYHEVSQPASQPGFGCHHAEQSRAKKKPWRLVRKVAEGHVELDDHQHPKQVAPDQPSKRMRNGLGNPSKNHEGGNR
jgi:hypothetical protein